MARRPKEPPQPAGRPTLYTPELFAAICEELGKGVPLAVICRTPGYPDPSNVWRWTKEDPALQEAYEAARAVGFDAIAQDCLEIADDTGNDTKYGDDGQPRADAEWISRSKLRVETRLKLLAKWDPKRYGDKVALTGGGPDDPPIRSELKVTFV